MHNNCYCSFLVHDTSLYELIYDDVLCILTGNRHVILDTCYVILAMLYLTHDTWHQYLRCYIWLMIPTLVLAILYLTHNIRHRYLPCYIWHMITGYRYLPCYIWHLIYDTGIWHAIFATWYITPDTWHMHDYCIITRHLVLLYLLYSCISFTPVLLYLLYSCSC